MQGRGTRFVTPLVVVEQEQHRSLRRFPGHQGAEASEQAVTMIQLAISENFLLRTG
jgi:hypothetical protein